MLSVGWRPRFPASLSFKTALMQDSGWQTIDIRWLPWQQHHSLSSTPLLSKHAGTQSRFVLCMSFSTQPQLMSLLGSDRKKGTIKGNVRYSACSRSLDVSLGYLLSLFKPHGDVLSSAAFAGLLTSTHGIQSRHGHRPRRARKPLRRAD